MNIEIFDENNLRTSLDNIISVEIMSDVDAACDSLKVTFLCHNEIGSITKVKAYDNGNLLFSGICDVKRKICDKSGTRYFVFARSLASYLVDNEAQPTTLFHPTSSQLFYTFCSEFPVQNKLPPLFVNDYYEVAKGKSRFASVNDFVKAVTGDGIYVEPNGDVVCLCHKGKSFDLNSLDISSLITSEKRCEPISKINYKADSSGGYDHHFESMLCSDCKIKRERYVNLCAYPAWQRDSLVKNISDNSFKEYKTLDVKVVGTVDVSVFDNCIYYGNTYKVKSKSIVLNSFGCHTVLSLFESIDKRTVNYVD